MKKNNEKFKISEVVLLELDPKKSPYPRRYRFFDTDYARENNQWISNTSIRDRLRKEAALGKMVFDYKKHHHQIYCISGDFLSSGRLNFEFYDIFAGANILSNVAKFIIKTRSRNKLINFFGDFDALNSYYSHYNEKLRRFIGVYPAQDYYYTDCNPNKKTNYQSDFAKFLHPYIRHAMFLSDNDLLDAIDDKNYKSLEADFIRTANSTRQKIENFLKRNFIENSKIFICRFDVILRDGGEEVLPKTCSIQNYRKQVDAFLDPLVQFDCALDVIFPSALLAGEIIPSDSSVGQIVLVSTDRVSANKKELREFASQVSRSGFLDFLPAKPFPKDLAPNVDGVLKFSSSTEEAINWLAEFLTIERRFVAPGQGCTDGSGTAHCFRYIDLKR